MEMRFKLLPFLPWKPSAIFTGITKYDIDLDSGLITRHADEWDSVKNNDYLSLEALQYTLQSFTSVRHSLSPGAAKVS
jgi:hypothetical protein